MLLCAIKAVLDDPGFSISSPLAANAVQSAHLFLEWSKAGQNRDVLDCFASELISVLRTAFTTHSATRPKVQRERMWGQYHVIRSSHRFRERWSSILRRIEGCDPCPIFFQYVTDNVFRHLVKTQFSVCKMQQTTNTTDLTDEETSALRYAAGYVCRAMKKEYKSNPEVLLAIDELVDDNNGEGDEGSDYSNEWTKLTSRGGLIFIKDATCIAFHAMEVVVRQYFCKEKVDKLSPGGRDLLIQAIKENDDVAFYWCMVFADVEDSVATTLLHSIIKLWVTMRGFAFASSWIELYKQNAKKSLQRSKGLRKTLFTDQ